MIAGHDPMDSTSSPVAHDAGVGRRSRDGVAGSADRRSSTSSIDAEGVEPEVRGRGRARRERAGGRRRDRSNA